MNMNRNSVILYISLITCLLFTVTIGVIVLLNLTNNNWEENYAGNRKKKEEIISFFHENKNLIEKSIQDKKYGELKRKGVLSVDSFDDYIRFECDGVGIVPASVDYGFIFSKIHDTDRFYHGSDDYKKIETRYGYYYDDLFGDNDFYIEMIEEDYYYYQQFW